MENSIRNVAVVIPSYRSGATIQKVIRAIPDWVSHIIVVDDKSPDNATELVLDEASRNPRLHLVAHHTNQGVGGAVLSGYRRALELGAEILVKMDSDDQMDPDYIVDLIQPIIRGEADYTKGNRFLFGEALKAMPITRRAGNLGLSFLTKLASGYWNIFDPTNGFTALRAEMFSFLNVQRIDPRYFFETSILIELGLQQAVVVDVPIPARYGDNTSSLSEWKTLFEFPPKLLSGLLRRIFNKYFLVDFTAVSIFLLAGTGFTTFGILWGTIQWMLAARAGVAATTGTVMIAVLPLIVGLQLILQAIVMDIQNTPSVVYRRKRR